MNKHIYRETDNTTSLSNRGWTQDRWKPLVAGCPVNWLADATRTSLSFLIRWHDVFTIETEKDCTGTTLWLDISTASQANLR